MKIYLVGGAVRDALLNLPVKEKDWVVVGATPEEMASLGYKPVGKDFPVFLHPETKEEYALARTEKKVGKGYKGFTFYTDPSVTLEQDLIRRDLTINAIAQDTDQNYIDPFAGKKDLEKKILRHVSPAFVEDPVRILRIARFAARFPDFTIHPETKALMKKMVVLGEVDALVPERVWQECETALHEKNPLRFFEVLELCGALERLWPQFIFSDTAKNALKQACDITTEGAVRLAAVWHTLPREAIEQYAKHYRLPSAYSELLLMMQGHFAEWRALRAYEPQKILVILQKLDAFRRPERFENFLKICVACSPHLPIAKKLAEEWRVLFKAAARASSDALKNKGLQGPAFGKALEELRCTAIQESLIKNVI